MFTKYVNLGLALHITITFREASLYLKINFEIAFVELPHVLTLIVSQILSVSEDLREVSLSVHDTLHCVLSLLISFAL
jgi:hypothetical protein